MHKTNDPLIFEDVYESYADRILNLAYRFAGDEDTARDLTQDVFVKVYENLHKFEHKSHVFTWIYRIAVNHFTNYLKKEKRHNWVSLMDHTVSDLFRQGKIHSVYPGSAVPPSSQQNMESAERAEIVWASVQTLPPKYRVPLVLHHYEGMAYKDIAAVMEISMSAVEARIHRAKKRLIKKLEPWLDKL